MCLASNPTLSLLEPGQVTSSPLMQLISAKSSVSKKQSSANSGARVSMNLYLSRSQ